MTFLNNYKCSQQTVIPLFLLSRIQIVNLTESAISQLRPILARNSCLVQDHWVRSLTYAFRMKRINKSGMIKLISELLVHLHSSGWEPLTPVTIGSRQRNMSVTICFKYKGNLQRDDASLRGAGGTRSLDVPQATSSCSIEFRDKTMIFYSVPATVLADLVTTCSSDLAGVSAGVVSIISDYIALKLPVISRPSVFVEFLRKPLRNRALNLTNAQSLDSLNSIVSRYDVVGTECTCFEPLYS